MATSKEEMMQEADEGKTYWQFGSNRYAELNNDGTVFYNTYNLEYMDFDNLSDFAEWWFNDSLEVTFMYQYAIGSRDEDVNETIEDPDFKGEINHDANGSTVWTKSVRITGADRPS